MDIAAHYLETARFEFGMLKRQTDRAIEQLASEEDWRFRLDDEANSVAILVQHLSGNLLSRWTDFLDSDGEKPTRHRDREFFSPSDSDEVPADQATRLARWEKAWALVFEQLERLGPEDLERTVTIRGEEFTVVEALQRQLLHISQHVGQIVLLTKHLAGERWQTLSIPRGQSASAAGSYKNR